MKVNFPHKLIWRHAPFGDDLQAAACFDTLRVSTTLAIEGVGIIFCEPLIENINLNFFLTLNMIEV